MPGYKSARLAEDIKREIGALLQDLKDPRIKNGMISVVRVETSHDASFARVYISAMEGMSAARLAVKGLTHATGLIKRELSNRLHLRKCPDLKFVPDDSMEYSAHLNQMFSDLHAAQEQEQEK